jgi:hypothetical protein
MRAKEFIIERSDQTKVKGKLSKRQRMSTNGLHLFTDSNYDRSYGLNRVMMAVACADGSGTIDMDPESWVGKRNTAHPYTEIESKMLKDAYKLTGQDFNDLNNGDMHSDELDSTNKKSPVNPFKGYKK